jgi:hypothetical protein
MIAAPARPGFSENVPGPVPGPLPVREPAAGFHTAAPDRGLPGVIQAGAGSGNPFPDLWRLALAVVTILVAVWVCTSCTNIKGDRNAGTYSYSSFAGNAKFGELGPEGIRNGEIDNSTGATIAKDSVEAIGRAYAWGKAWDAAGKLIDEGFDALKDSNSTDEAINANNNATKAEIKTFVPPPVEAPPVP